MTVLGVDNSLRPRGRKALAGLLFLALVAALLVSMPSRAEAACTGNAIVCENQLPGTPASEWDIDGAGDDSIQGFATQISVNAGSQIQFKIDTDATRLLDQDLSARLLPGRRRAQDRHDRPVSQLAAAPAGMCDRSRHRDLRLRDLGGISVLDCAERRGVRCLHRPSHQTRQRGRLTHSVHRTQ